MFIKHNNNEFVKVTIYPYASPEDDPAIRRLITKRGRYAGW